MQKILLLLLVMMTAVNCSDSLPPESSLLEGDIYGINSIKARGFDQYNGQCIFAYLYDSTDQKMIWPTNGQVRIKQITDGTFGEEINRSLIGGHSYALYFLVNEFCESPLCTPDAAKNWKVDGVFQTQGSRHEMAFSIDPVSTKPRLSPADQEVCKTFFQTKFFAGSGFTKDIVSFRQIFAVLLDQDEQKIWQGTADIADNGRFVLPITAPVDSSQTYKMYFIASDDPNCQRRHLKWQASPMANGVFVVSGSAPSTTGDAGVKFCETFNSHYLN